MTWNRSENEVNEMIKQMTERTKGNYLTQGVSFNKNCPRQMNLLKNALMASASFSGLAKELLALRFGAENTNNPSVPQNFNKKNKEKKDLGNFL
ncbi:hypothetical protein Q7A53_05970 [Halobacillus rhizosphaerae]|uniref:hypothetical protein n=1 Tax=Halobacillus rhizosphaerae TaxID=3064889 RepID=UPI00398B6883